MALFYSDKTSSRDRGISRFDIRMETPLRSISYFIPAHIRACSLVAVAVLLISPHSPLNTSRVPTRGVAGLRLHNQNWKSLWSWHLYREIIVSDTWKPIKGRFSRQFLLVEKIRFLGPVGSRMAETDGKALVSILLMEVVSTCSSHQ